MQAAASSVVENIAAPLADDDLDQLPPCLWADPTTAQDTLVQASTIAPATLEQKKTLFLSAPKFAVVGASMNDSKNGSKVGYPNGNNPDKPDHGVQALKWLVEQHKDVVPVNLEATEIQGIKCIKSLSELPDPTHTSVSIVVPPKVHISSSFRQHLLSNLSR
jgi:predicted CoA-binding protein